ncbi:CU044_2847 family protein [Aeromonas intestinalis]
MERSKIIYTDDGIGFEVSVTEEFGEYEISSGMNHLSLDSLEELLKKVTKPFTNVYDELNKDIEIESAKLSIGVKVGVQGSFFIAKSSGEANIGIEITMRTKK